MAVAVKRVLFVDDETKVLDGLRRMLRKLRDEWEIEFAAGGGQALELLRSWPCDVVVSDMRMPGIDGSQLLHEVMQRHGSTVRIILSGQCDRQSVLKAVGLAHQFLTKPCDAETLKTTVSRACGLRDQLAEDHLRRTVSCVRALPSLPEIYWALDEELSRANPSPSAVARLVDADVALTARLLQLVSSSFFGTPRGVSSAAEAAELLGMETLRELWRHTGVFRPAAPGSPEERLLRMVVEHSGAVAKAAQAIAQAETGNPALAAEAFLAGWVHDVGVLVNLDACAEDYAEMVGCAWATRTGLAAAEKSRFGSSRAEVGAYLLGLWGLGDPIVRAAGLHLAPQAPPNAAPERTPRPASGGGCGFEPLAAVHVAHSLVTQAQPCCDLPSQIAEEYLQQIGCAERLPQWREACSGAIASGGNA